MLILRDLLLPLQEEFSHTEQGQKRKVWFAYTLLAVVVPFTSSITSNLLRALQTLFGLDIQSQRFYTFMASTTLPWKGLWQAMWGMIPSPATEERIIVALDDSINPKSGRKIFGCAHFHNHATKGNQNSYPWSQCILAIGLLKKVKSRWACLPLDFRFYMMKKDIEAGSATAKQKGKVLPFETKMKQAATMIKEVRNYFHQSVLIVTDSWFGNNGLWFRLDRGSDGVTTCFPACVQILRCMILCLRLQENGKQVGHESMANVWVLWMIVQPNGRKKLRRIRFFCTAKKGKCRCIHRPLC